MSSPSVVVHCFCGTAMLATNMSGSAWYAPSEVDPPWMLIGAQFMYISRLPILLNQVQTKTAFPPLMSAGMVKSRGGRSLFGSAGKLPTADIGHAPSNDLMTL